jgi:hypothetical protein
MLAFLAGIRIFFQTRVDISLEVLALRQQVAVLKRKRPRPLLNNLDRFFWTTFAESVAEMVGCSRHRETRDGHRAIGRASAGTGAGDRCVAVDRR